MIYHPDGTVYEPGDFDWRWVDTFCDMMAHTSPQLRAEIQNEVAKRVARKEAQSIFGYCDLSHAADLSEKWRGWGRNYLYVWLDGEGTPFYVGKAEDASRMGQFAYKTRSEAFQQKIREGGCHSVMVAKHIPAKRIDELEKHLISYLCWRGFPLVNIKDMPSKEQMLIWSVFRSCKNDTEAQARLGVGVGDLFREWQANMEELVPVISALDEVIGVKWEGECADLTPKAKKPPETVTYNGETKTWGAWGKAIGVSGGTIKNRVEKLGWPLEKALFEPSAQAKTKKEREERLKKHQEESVLK